METRNKLAKSLLEKAWEKWDRIHIQIDKHLGIINESATMLLKLTSDVANSREKKSQQKFVKMIKLRCKMGKRSSEKLMKLMIDLQQILTDIQNDANKVVTSTHRTRSTRVTGTNTAPGGEDNGDMDVSDPGSADEPEM